MYVYVVLVMCIKFLEHYESAKRESNKQLYNICINIPVGLDASTIFSDAMASASLPHVGEGTSRSHNISISLHASTE